MANQKGKPTASRRFLPRPTRRNAAVGLLITVVLLIIAPVVLRSPSAGRLGAIAPFFAREVRYWDAKIAAWAEQYAVDPNLIATLMQIESCGWAEAISPAGAQGLFQVMPFHFAPEEQSRMTDPDTNARRGIGVIVDCMRRAENDFGLAMACYNGGPRWIDQPMASWPRETRSYHFWGTGIYSDARRGAATSPTLDEWLRAGGDSLCRQAAAALGLPTATPLPPDLPTPALPTLELPGLAAPALTPGALATLPPAQTTLIAPGEIPTFDGSHDMDEK